MSQIQESVLGEDHKIVASTKESIDFVVRAKEEQVRGIVRCADLCVL